MAEAKIIFRYDFIAPLIKDTHREKAPSSETPTPAVLRQTPTQILRQNLLEGATIYFYCLFDESYFCTLKSPLLCLRQLLTTESPLIMMKNSFYFTLKALFILKIFECSS